MLRQLVLLLLLLQVSSFSQNVHAHAQFNCLKTLKSLVTPSKPKPLAKTWGVEIELNHGNKYTVDEIAQHLAEFFRMKGFEEVRVRMQEGEYETAQDFFVEYKHKGKLRSWGLPHEPDFLMTKIGSYPGFELTTPIMTGSKDQELLAEVLEFFKLIHIKPAREVGGTHTHWGVDKMDYNDLIRVYSAYIKIYDEIEDYFSPDLMRSYIDKSELKTTLHKLQKSIFPDMQITEESMMQTVFVDGPIRYNWKYKTIETRFFNSTMDSEEILFNVVFSKRFIEKVIQDDSFYFSLDDLFMPEILQQLDIPN